MRKEDGQNSQENQGKKGIGIVILVEDTDRIEPEQAAKVLSAETGFPVVTAAYIQRTTGSAKKANTKTKAKVKEAVALWQLVYAAEGLVLRLSNEPTWGDIRVDFASSALLYRKQHGGGRNEAIAKAIGIKGKESLSVIDCTAGMGSDSFVMASVGAKVTMLERSPVISALLEDALKRLTVASSSDESGFLEELSANLELVKANATDYINQQSIKPLADVIYLDPMFPHKKKSALVKKEMRAFQQLLGADTDSSELLEAALNYAGKRVVVKRPSYAEAIALPSGRMPTTAIESKKHRFDVYIQHC
ncbi:class I SAM-dependent methyltransferase [Glaciecola sp. MH2013]|nr:class I SAM-dependent methyltransferase [Glaciecola sp. MH2013]